MSIFARPEYESEFTQFLKELKQSNPAIVERQLAGRALLWDKSPIDQEESRRTVASKEKREAYAYR